MAMRHLERWAVTRTGYGRRVNGQDFIRFVPAGLAASMWLQGTSRDGDPHDHVHCAIARMCFALAEHKWLAVDTMALRAQAGAAKLIADAYVQSALAREFGLGWVPAPPAGCGNEVRGVTQEQMRIYSSRAQEIDRGVEAGGPGLEEAARRPRAEPERAAPDQGKRGEAHAQGQGRCAD